MNLTMSQLKPVQAITSIKAGFGFSKHFVTNKKHERKIKDIFSPVNQQTIKLNVTKSKSVIKDGYGSPSEQQNAYPVQVHSKTLPIQIEKLRNQFLTTRTF